MTTASGVAPGAGGALRPRDYLGFFGMVVGLFMALLDIQIVASSLHDIQAGISASLDEISWIQTSYLIAEVIMIPIAGWLAQVMSTRWLYVTAAGGFTLMSLASAMAWDINSMIISRSLQGFFSGAMIPTVFSTIYRLFPQDKQAKATIGTGLVVMIAPTLGPTLGGWITQNFSWHWLFLVNIVPGLLVCLAVASFVAIDRPNPALLRRADLVGILLVAVFLGCGEFVLEEGPGEDWFDSDLIINLSLLTFVAGVLFLWRELTYPDPVVNLRAFRDRNFTIGCLYSFVIGVGLFGSTFVMPLFLSSVLSYNSLQIGTVMMVTGAFQFLSGPLAGMLEKRIDLRLMMAMGLSLFATGLVLNSFMTADVGFAHLFAPQALRGLGIMLCFVPITTLALGRLPPEALNNASGLYTLMRNLGGAMGIAIINTVFEIRYDLHYLRLSETVREGSISTNTALSQLAARLHSHYQDLERSTQAALKMIQALVQREATVMAYNDVFLLIGGMFALGLFLMPLVRKVEAGAAPAGAH